MKRLFFAMLTSLLLVGSVMAAPVEKKDALRLAVNFWNTYRPRGVEQVSDMQLLPVAELNHMYVFSAGSEGFVIVSADDQVEPVVGYSFDTPASKELNPEVRFWLTEYDLQIALWKGRMQPAHPRWSQLLNDPVPATPIDLTAVAPLCTTRWDQSYPFNNMCPYDSVESDRAVVGCVATAMAQIMKRWDYPSCGTGSHQYQHSFMSDMGYTYGLLTADFAHTTYMWQDMPNKVSNASSVRVQNAVSTLSYHCGVSVDMMYGTVAHGGSGAYSSCGGWASACAENAFVQYFKYSPTLHYEQRNTEKWGDTSYTLIEDAEWIAMVDTELNAGRPIYYDGSDYSGGHAFVLDGSNADGKYHFNWGWSGSYNGYYLMSNIAPGAGGVGGNATYSFNYGQGAIFGIEPLGETFDTIYVKDTVCTNSPLYAIYEYEIEPATVDTLLRHLDTIVVLSLTAEYSNFAVFSANNGNFGDQVEVEYCYREGITAPECTFAKDGHFFIGWAWKKSGSAHLYQAGDTINAKGNVTLFARWQDSSRAVIPDMELDGSVSVWPNPTASELYIEVPAEIEASVYLIDALGRKELAGQLHSGKGKISLSDYPKGVYLLQVRADDKLYNVRIIKQ